MLGKARAQIAGRREPCGIAHRNGDIDGRQVMLVQAKRFSSQTLDVVTDNGAGAGARRYRQSQPRIRFMIGQNGQAKIRVGNSSANLPNFAKFGRLVQTLARLELQCTDGWTAWGGSLRGRGACGPSHGAEQATADRSW